MTSALVEKLSDVRDFRKILETTVKELGEHYEADVSQIVLSNPLDGNITSICEYLSNPDEPASTELPFTTFPLHLEGGGLGIVNISRLRELSENESNEIRITLSQITALLRYAQINDIVQRDTFRSAFMSEITNLLTLPMGLGDALFLVVNILGKALNCNRCLFICTDDMQAGWKCYEYWQREKLESSQEYGWPSKDSAIVSQSLLASTPLVAFEGQNGSYLTPVQEEMQLIGVRSLLAVPIRSSIGCHGSIIVQQCESRHAWTRDEVDMVQNAADTVAEMLAALPEEKKEMEPIMRLHQRDVAETKDAAQQNIQDIRRALKGALGQTKIESARDTAAAKQAKAAALAPPPPPPEPIQEPDYAEPEAEAAWDGSQDYAAAQQAGEGQEYPGYEGGDQRWAPEGAEGGYGEQGQYPGYEQPQGGYEQGWDPNAQAEGTEPAGEWPTNGEGGLTAETPADDLEQWDPEQWEETPAASTLSMMGGLADAITGEAGTSADPPSQSTPPSPTGRSSLGGVLGGIFGSRSSAPATGAWDIDTSQPLPPGPAEAAGEPAWDDASQTEETPEQQPDAVAGDGGGPDSISKPAAEAPGKWGNLDAIPAPGKSVGGQPPAPSAANAGNQTASGSKWGNLDSIPAPGESGPAAKPVAAQAPGKWGNLDAIPAPGKPGAAGPAPGGPDAVKPVPGKPVSKPAAKPGPAQPAPQDKGGKWGNLEAIPAPNKGGSDSWGDLDSIPTPGGPGGASGGASGGGGGGRGGLGGAMMGKARASAVLGGAGLQAAFGKAGAKPSQYVDGPPAEIDEAAAEEKIKAVMNAADPTSDYIFETPGLDARLLGRIDGWVSQVESKDKYVGGHARQIAEYSQAIARMMGLSPEEVTEVRLAAIVHDVGKLGLSGQILVKPDEALNDSELFEKMKHPLNGAKLLEGFPELASLVPIVLAHHEEYNGEGYPEGLAGDAIPLAARIIFVANAYHGMVADLTYRQGMPAQQAQQNLRTGAGIAYDPMVVDALIAAISQGLVPARVE